MNQHSTYTSTIIKFPSFFKFGPGLYYFDTADSNKSPVNTYSFLFAVKYNKSYLVDVKLKERIELENYRGKLAGFLNKTTKIS